MCWTGFPSLLACPQVSFVPPLRRRSRQKITVPSLSSMFLLVRAGYEIILSSNNLYRSAILPSSAFRPLGTYPPYSRPVSIAKSSPARSAPVWPPDMIFRSILSYSSLKLLLRRAEVRHLIRKRTRISKTTPTSSHRESHPLPHWRREI